MFSALAKALRVSEDYLLSSEEMVDAGGVRKKNIASKREEAFVEGQALHLLERAVHLEDALGLASVVWDRRAKLPIRSRPSPTPKMRLGLCARIGAWASTRFKICRNCLEERGIKILSVDLSDIDGLTARVRRKNGEPIPVIVVKESEWSKQSASRLAHELGHMVMDVRHGEDAEKAANRVAGAFLMPAEALWREIGKHRTTISLGELLRLKELFGASFQAIVYRCHDLGIISDAAYGRMFQAFSKVWMAKAALRRAWRHPSVQRAAAPDAAPMLPRSIRGIRLASGRQRGFLGFRCET